MEENNDDDVMSLSILVNKNVKLGDNRIDNSSTSQSSRQQKFLEYQKENTGVYFEERDQYFLKFFESTATFEVPTAQVPEKKAKKMNSRWHDKIKIMCSEWMEAVPADFPENWIMLPCPKGRRVLLITSARGRVDCYSRKGKFIRSFSSLLPGTNEKISYQDCTVLDGIYSENDNIIYALDIIAWPRQVLVSFDTEFRFHFLKSKLEEIEGISNEVSGRNDIPIKVLKYKQCTQNILNFLKDLAVDDFPLDGFLFYHKETQYYGIKSPLVLWLKPYMIPDVFTLVFTLSKDEIPEIYYDQKPANYFNLKKHLKEV